MERTGGRSPYSSFSMGRCPAVDFCRPYECLRFELFLLLRAKDGRDARCGDGPPPNPDSPIATVALVPSSPCDFDTAFCPSSSGSSSMEMRIRFGLAALASSFTQEKVR